jgi:hypothetical protein
VSAPEPDKYKVELGPFFSLGAVLLVYGLVRRKFFAVAAGLGAIFLDQRTELGRSLKEKARAKYMTVQYVQDRPAGTSEAELGVEDDRDRPVVRDLHGHPSAEDAGRDADT